MNDRNRLKAAKVTDIRYTREILDDAIENIPKGEEIIVALKGAFREYLICTNKRIYIVKKGFMTGNTFGSGNFQMPYSNITNVEVVDKMMTGYFEVSAGGMQNTVKSYWDTSAGTGSATNQPNSISLNDEHSKGLFKKASIIIMDMADNYNNYSSYNEAVTEKKDDKFDEIIKYKELLDLGIINEDEFEDKKNQLLN